MLSVALKFVRQAEVGIGEVVKGPVRADMGCGIFMHQTIGQAKTRLMMPVAACGCFAPAECLHLFRHKWQKMIPPRGPHGLDKPCGDAVGATTAVADGLAAPNSLSTFPPTPPPSCGPVPVRRLRLMLMKIDEGSTYVGIQVVPMQPQQFGSVWP